MILPEQMDEYGCLPPLGGALAVVVVVAEAEVQQDMLNMLVGFWSCCWALNI